MKVSSPKMDVEHGIALDKWQEHFNSYCFESPPSERIQGGWRPDTFMSLFFTGVNNVWSVSSYLQKHTDIVGLFSTRLGIFLTSFKILEVPSSSRVFGMALNLQLPCSARESHQCRWWYVGAGCPVVELPLEWLGKSHRQSLGAIQTN